MANQPGQESTPHPESAETEQFLFEDKMRELLPGIDFKESDEMHEARTAVVQAYTTPDQHTEIIHAVWKEYSDICQEAVDTAMRQPPVRAQLQITILIHEALIFLEIGNEQRYAEVLAEAEEYAYHLHLDEIVRVINAELEALDSQS